MSIMTMVPGGFFVFACVMAAVHHLTRDKSKIRKDFGCSACAMENSCSPERKALESGACAVDEKTKEAMKIAKAAEEKSAAAKTAAASAPASEKEEK